MPKLSPKSQRGLVRGENQEERREEKGIPSRRDRRRTGPERRAIALRDELQAVGSL